MTKGTHKLFWVLILIITFSVLFTSYKTLIQKNFIIIEEEETEI